MKRDLAALEAAALEYGGRSKDMSVAAAAGQAERLQLEGRRAELAREETQLQQAGLAMAQEQETIAATLRCLGWVPHGSVLQTNSRL